MYFIADIGDNNYGDVHTLLTLMNHMKAAGADCIKIQYRIGDGLCEKDLDFIDEYARTVGIPWTASVWDIPSLTDICRYKVPFIKIPSPCVTDIELLQAIARRDIPVVMSVGMSELAEIKQAVRILNDCDLTIMYSKSCYPQVDYESNLPAIITLKMLFPGRKIGYSGHETGVGATIIAAALGAQTIERHTVVRTNSENCENESNLSIQEVKNLLAELSHVEAWMSSSYIGCLSSEETVKHKMRRS